MRALIAARPATCRALQQMLQDTLDLVLVHNMADAFDLLNREPRDVDLILSTVTFDESRMIEFLQAVKRQRKLRNIPFFCARVSRGVVGEDVIEGVGMVCKECGAIDFVDLAQLPKKAAAQAIRATLGL